MLTFLACRRACSHPNFQGMPGSVKPSDYERPVCQGRSRVPGWLPGRTKLCDACHGTGHADRARRAAEEGEAAGVAAANVVVGAHFGCTTRAMATKAPTLTDCPTCGATGKVQSRLAFRPNN